MSKEIIERRNKILTEMGYIISRVFPSGYAYKEFKDYKYQGHGWIKYADTARKDLYAITDEQFAFELSLLPERELKAQKELEEFIAARRQEIEDQKNEREKQNVYAEGNFQISVFNGWTYKSLEEFKKDRSSSELHNYHQDWNKLMDVVKKCINSYHDMRMDIFSALHKADKDKVWLAVVDFIQWSKKNKHLIDEHIAKQPN